MCTGGAVSPRLPRGDHSRSRFRSILLGSRLRLLSNALPVGHAGAQASVLLRRGRTVRDGGTSIASRSQAPCRLGATDSSVEASAHEGAGAAPATGRMVG